jgi:hypothetical protein
MRLREIECQCPTCGTTAKKTTSPLDGHFLEKDLYKHPSGECHLDVMYLEPPNKRTRILTTTYASQDLLMKAFVDESETKKLSTRARELVPAVATREADNFAMMKDLPFEPRDLKCYCCGARPGEPCFGRPEHCQEWRLGDLRHFLIWLAEQRHRQPKKLTKKLIIDVAEMMGYCTAENLYYRGDGVVLTQWSTGDCWRFYVGGRLDPTKSVWMTRGSDLSDPERGPLRDEKEIALAMRTVRAP